STSEQLAARFANGVPESVELEIGVVTHGGAALLKLDRAAIIAALPGRSTAYQSLSVTALALLLEKALGIDAAAATAGALRYVRGSAAAVASALSDPVPSAAILLHGERPEQVVAVAEAGETMPQKSTLFAPKPPTGLLFLAHEINRVS
ncbi:MAG: putative Site-specific DNA-methyltransferase domain, partial [Chloroflexota bacterium]